MCGQFFERSAVMKNARKRAQSKLTALDFIQIDCKSGIRLKQAELPSLQSRSTLNKAGYINEEVHESCVAAVTQMYGTV